MAALGRLAPLRTSARNLRILAYHGVNDASRLAAQCRYLVDRYEIVDAETALAILAGRRSADHTAWITFDDGERSVVENGMPILRDVGVPATLFICPGLVESDEPFWWDTARRAGLSVNELKGLPDHTRRSLIRERGLRTDHEARRRNQLSAEEISGWTSAGNTIANHSWDHPILTMCTPDAQVEQIVKAHDWLEKRNLGSLRVFAYPNGDWSPVAESVLRDLDYSAALLFDHRIARVGQGLRTSRIRVNADDDLSTFIARVSGWHPGLHHLLSRP